MPKENVNSEEESTITETGKSIKREMDRYQDKIKSGEQSSAPTGDPTRSEE
jgi:hypothetical protein